VHTGRQFLQVPGPTNLPETVQRALSRPLLDHRGPEFAALSIEVIAGLCKVFGTTSELALFPASGTGAWEAALVNTLSPSDLVIGFEQGHFAGAWHDVARRFGLQVEVLAGDPRFPPDADALRERLAADPAHKIQAVLLVHNETSTGVCVDVGPIRAAIDDAGHEALLFVDVISSLASTSYSHDDWRVDVSIGASQKGLMLPPGLAFNAISTKALDRAGRARLPRSYWDWKPHLEAARSGWFPYTPATTLLFGLQESLRLLFEEGLDNLFTRHARHAALTRAAVHGWGLETYCADEAAHSSTVTTVLVPDTADAEELRALLRSELDLILGVGLGRLRGKAFRIGHLGSLNDLMLLGTLAGVEIGLRRLGIGVPGGLAAALDHVAEIDAPAPH
jgi:alanine-glyoxylate transaminase / serine-glyoxylate transaminase / serine-pyruvate transaminase